MNILRTIIEICLLRGKPQDLPASAALVVVSALVSVAIDVFSIPEGGLQPGPALFVLVQTLLFGAAVWVALRQRGFPARWLQTVTALYAVNALFSLMLLPLLPALVEMIRQGPEVTVGWPGYVALLLTGWFLAVVARVVREAMELSPLGGFLVSLALILAVRAAGFVLAPLFGFTGPV
jgi:hypothetical protein